jgi:hypothetical protein
VVRWKYPTNLLPPCESAATLFCANCPRSSRSFAAHSSSVTNDVASRDGPKYYLSVSYPGLRPQMDYVPQESHAQTAEFLANHHQAREILEKVCEINRELLRRREAL